MLKPFMICGLIFLTCLLSKLFTADCLPKLLELNKNLAERKLSLNQMAQQNIDLANKIYLIKTYPDTVEELARNELGMIKKNETFYQLIEPIK